MERLDSLLLMLFNDFVSSKDAAKTPETAKNNIPADA